MKSRASTKNINARYKDLESIKYIIKSYLNQYTYDLNEYFDDKCIEIINNIYKKDFLLFDYEIILINKLKT